MTVDINIDSDIYVKIAHIIFDVNGNSNVTVEDSDSNEISQYIFDNGLMFTNNLISFHGKYHRNQTKSISMYGISYFTIYNGYMKWKLKI